MNADHPNMLRTLASGEQDAARKEAIYAAADAFEALAIEADKLKNLLAVSTEFKLGSLVRKASGPEWDGQVVGYYSSSFTPEGLVIECTVPGAIGQVHVEPSKRILPR